MRKAIIVHCWEGYPEYCWYPHTKKSLEQLGFKVLVPQFPDTKEPKLQKWLPFLHDKITEPNNELFLIGHSVGCVTILKYLESLPERTKVGGVILVAGFTKNIGYEELKSFFKTDLDFKKIKSHCDNFVAIHSTNDKYVDLKFADVFKKELNAMVIIKENMGHFSGTIENENSCLELPEVIESIKKIYE